MAFARWSARCAVALTFTAAVCCAGSKPAPTRPRDCPVDARPVRASPESPQLRVHDHPWYFCSPGCRERFLAWPEKYVKLVLHCPVQPGFKAWIQRSRRAEVNNGLYFLCCDPCVGWIRDKPWLYFKELPDPVSGKPFAPTESSPRLVHQGQVYVFASEETRSQFQQDPQKYVVLFRR